MALARAVKDVFIVAAKRTPFGTYGGSLANFTAIDLQEIASRAALTAGGIKPELINSVIVGSVFYATSDGPYISRHSALRVGIPEIVPAQNINRMCGSGFQSVITASQEIELGISSVVLTGGTETTSICLVEIELGISSIVLAGGAETMSMSPHYVHGARFGSKLGIDLKMEDMLWQGLIDKHCNTPMGVTAENLAVKYGLTREQTDAYGLLSQQRWKRANDAGIFKEEMAPITLKTRKGEKVMDTDEHPRPDVTLESLGKLPTVFKKGGTVTAGNASGICDGAGAVVVASAQACKEHNLKPLARLVGYGISGCDPTIMGIGPVPAIQVMLTATGKTLQDMDLVEVNEAFAPQYLSVEKELGLDPEKTNLNGGAIAMGHPVGASGSRITAHLVHELRRRGAKYAAGSACIGGGQGIAILLESIN
ncbi:3-ketoacyl-CoA thiolase, mitochondrial [Lamellibrachia satsuma]|nr:3-ketoacyl-CoA thiolase, mitochondrial [Lamellibrachia satsuma]